MQLRIQLFVATKANAIIIIASIVSSIVSKIISPWSNSGTIAINCLVNPDLSYFIKNSCLWNVSWRFLNVARLELGRSKKTWCEWWKTNVTLSIKYIYNLYSSSPILRTKLVITRVTHHLVGCKTHVTSPKSLEYETDVIHQLRVFGDNLSLSLPLFVQLCDVL